MSYAEDDDDLSAEERAFFLNNNNDWNERKAAAERRQAGSIAARQSLAGGVDPSVVAEATARRQAEHAAALITPATLAGRNEDPNRPTISVPTDFLPGPSASMPIPMQQLMSPANVAHAPAGRIVFWCVTLITDERRYGVSWEDLKEAIKDNDGCYVAVRHEFNNTPTDILAFFTGKTPTNLVHQDFDVIVSGHKVFKAE